MKLYELTYLISLETNQQKIKSVSEKIFSLIKEQIKEQGGVLEEQENLVKKILGYSIQKQGAVYLGVIKFFMDSLKLEIIQNKLKNELDIIRFFLVSKKSQKTKPREIFTEKSAEITQKIEKQKHKIELKEIDKKLEEILKEK